MHDNRPHIEPLDRAIQRLEEGLKRYQNDITDLQIRDGLIQRFEFTYEIAARPLRSTWSSTFRRSSKR